LFIRPGESEHPKKTEKSNGKGGVATIISGGKKRCFPEGKKDGRPSIDLRGKTSTPQKRSFTSLGVNGGKAEGKKFPKKIWGGGDASKKRDSRLR